jgi:hypothetical protein
VSQGQEEGEDHEVEDRQEEEPIIIPTTDWLVGLNKPLFACFVSFKSKRVGLFVLIRC